MNVAITYDRVNKFGGAERVLLTLHEMFPKASLFTSVYDSENAKWASVFPDIRTSFLQRIPFIKDNHEFFAWLMPFAFAQFNFDEYDLVISVTSEFAKNINVRKGKHICYCLTPTRYLWSHNTEYFENKYLRLMTRPLVSYLKKADIKASKKPDQIIAISSVVQKRIKKYYKRDAKIIFPPVRDIKVLKTRFFGPRKGIACHSFLENLNKDFKNYYLIVSRLVKYKKVDLAISAFNELNLPLVIVGTGREERKLKRIANKNIKFAGFVDQKDLVNLYKNAKGFIFPQEEDFGITAVEAQINGIPVIAYKAGGAVDTITKKTGIFFDEQNKESMVKAIKKFQKKRFNKKVIMKNAEKFSEKRFKTEFLKYVREVC